MILGYVVYVILSYMGMFFILRCYCKPKVFGMSKGFIFLIAPYTLILATALLTMGAIVKVFGPCCRWLDARVFNTDDDPMST